jgi:hypothetical protein
MADLTDIQAAESVKIIGADTTGLESNPMQVDSSNRALVKVANIISEPVPVTFDPTTTNPSIGQNNTNNPDYSTQVGGVDDNGSLQPIATDPRGRQKISVRKGVSYIPDIHDRPGDYDSLVAESDGAIRVRSQSFTDAGSFKSDFSGTSLTTALTGTLTFTNNSNTIIGIGTLFTQEVHRINYIKKTSDADTLYVAVAEIISDTEILLENVYTGTTGTTTAVSSDFITIIENSASISVSSSLITLSSGSSNGGRASIYRDGDYLPYSLEVNAALSQRIANQEITFGFKDIIGPSPNISALVVFNGTDNTKIKFRTRSTINASDLEETEVTLPKNYTTTTFNQYGIELTNKSAALIFNGDMLAIHKKHIPGPYDILRIGSSITNSAAVSNTDFQIEYLSFDNTDRVSVANDFSAQPVKSQIMGKSATTGLLNDLLLDDNGNLIVTSLTGFGANFNFGDINTAATTQVAVRRTAITEQTTNAQRSIASANANDTAAGTGARIVKITYLDQNGAGPYTELLTLNGTTGVNTIASNICYIEKIEVTSVGSGGSNAGIITLYSAINKGGVAIGTIAATDNQTFWAHHYVPVGKTCNVTGISCSHNGTTVGSGGVFVLKAHNLIVSGSPSIQVSDFVRLYGQSSTFSRTYTSPIKIVGPAHLEIFITPESSSALTYRSAIDYFEP